MSVRHFEVALGAPDAVHVLVPRQRYGRLDPKAKIETLAAPLLADLRKRQPTGPYRLAGFSIGGLIAYDLARSLRELGESIEWLGLLDAAPPSWLSQLSKRERWVGPIKRQLNRSPQERAERVAEKLARAKRRARLALGLRVRRLPSDFRLDGRAALVIGSRYSQPGQEIPVHLFVTQESTNSMGDPVGGWGQLHRGPMAVTHFGTNHDTFMAVPEVVELAEMVRAAMSVAASNADLPPAPVRPDTG
jgi:thioesterase domain-containing protein